MDYLIPNKVYDVLKWVSIIFLPTIAWALGELLPDYGIDPYVYVHFLDVMGMVIGALIGVSQLKANSTKQ